MKVQFYDGAVPMGAQAGGQVVLPQDVGAQERVAGWQRVAAGLDRLSATAVKLDDERKLMDGEAKLRAIQVAGAKRLENKLHVPDGDEGSLFEKDGRLRMSEVNKFERELEREYDEVGLGLQTAEGMSAMARAKKQSSARLLEDLHATAEKEARARLSFSFENNYDSAVKTGDYKRAAEIAVRAGQVGAWDALKSRKLHARVLAVGAVQASAQRRVPQLNMKRGGGRGKRRFSGVKFN